MVAKVLEYHFYFTVIKSRCSIMSMNLEFLGAFRGSSNLFERGVTHLPKKCGPFVILPYIASNRLIIAWDLCGLKPQRLHSELRL